MIQTNSLCAPLPLLVPNCKITFAAVSDDNPFFFAVMTSSPLLYFHFRPALSVLEKQHTGTKDSLSVSPCLLFPLNDSYAPAYQQYRDRLAVVHFIGNFKPWQWLRFADGAVFPRNTSSKDSIDLVQQWWNVFDNFVGGKPSDIHDVVHGYDLPPISQWDHVGLDGQPHEPDKEKRPHYDGWFQAYDHQNQAQQPPQEGYPDQWQPPIPPRLSDRIEWLHEQHHHQHHEHHQNHEQHHHQHHVHHDHHQNGHHEHHQNGHHEHQHHGHHEHHQNGHHEHHHHHGHQEQHQHEHHEHKHEHHQHHHHHHEQNGHHEHHDHHEQHHHQEPAVPHPPTHHEPHYAYNPHHLTDYHFQPPPLPPVIPSLPEPDSQSWGPNDTVNGADERQTQHKRTTSTTSVDREANPHHLTDYRYRLPPVVDSPDVANGAAKFGAIIPEPVGLPDMYYPNAWDLPEDPRKAHPTLEHKPLQIENTTNDDNTSVPSGKGRPIFPWEASGSVASTSRTPTRKYYNYAASAEERKRQHDLEVTRRLEIEEEALKQIRLQEHARYERERLKEEAQEQVTGSQAFENFRLVNAWDVDVGVQMSILQKTEKRRPRSRKSSAGGFRKGYGLEDMLAYEARQRQEQFEAELIQQRLAEEERWQKEQEEARIKEEELRLEKLRLAKIAKIRAQERLKKQEESSTYVFRNAWDPPNIGITKKKLRIEDEDIEFALPLRQDRKSSGSMTFGWGSSTSAPTREETVARAGRVAVAAGGAAAAGIALAARSGASQGGEESGKATVVSSRTARSAGSGAAVIKTEATTSSVDTDTIASKATKTTTSSTSTITEGATSAKKTTGSQGVISSTTTKITAPGTHRFVRTTVNTTITRRKFVNGVEVSSETTSNTTGGEKMFEIPAGPRSGSYFVGQGRRTESISRSQEASRLTGTTTTRATTATTATTNKASTQRTITSGHTSEIKTTHTEGDESSLLEGHSSTFAEGHKSIHTGGQKSAHGTHVISSVVAPVTVYQAGQQVTTAAATTSSTTATTATTTSTRSALQDPSHLMVSGLTSSSSHSGSSESTFRTEVVEEPRRLAGLALQINTGSPTKERRVEEEWASEYEERQRINDLREKNASAAAAAEAMQVLNRYPQATDRFATRRRADSTSSTKSIGGGSALYANDPHAYSAAFRSSAAREKSIKTSTARSDASGDEDDNVYQEDLDELEYFGTRHTRGVLPLGSPYMPSTPLAGSSQRYSAYSASASGFSSRAGSRPTTPGPGTPSRFGPGTPKLSSKRAFELKQGTIKGLQQPQSQSEQQQSGMGDFSNYRIEWNWKELLGKKPRHWSAEAGEEYYDPYNALSTHGSLIDSDEDDHILQSSDEDSEEEEEAALRAQQQKKSEGAEGAGFSRSSSSSSLRGSGAFATGADNDFTRESEFVIRGGKIARRRSSMVLDRELL
ncbi:hypothetical protein F5H01DRAFT_11968 [Linnemannia elongata]|nr:hypothetical protein F5H01DRAFT_11968 [Linnemannia elongata]